MIDDVQSIKLEVVPNTNKFRLLEDLTIMGHKIDKGFVTDFASVPRIFTPIVPKMGKYNRATIVHDYLIVSGQVPRKEADEIFLDIMLKSGVNKIRAYVMFYAVSAYREYLNLNSKL